MSRTPNIDDLIRREHYPADHAVNTLLRLAAEFEDRLDPDEEIAIFADQHPLRLRSIAVDGNLVIFGGLDDRGTPFQIVQAHQRVSIHFTSVPKAEGEPAFRVGFLSKG